MSDPPSRVAEAFSRQAAVYDSYGPEHVHLARLRAQVIAHLAARVPAGGRILELNAGTGLDALTLVQMGYRVHATDIAPGMLAAIEEKIDRHAVGERLTVQPLDFNGLAAAAGSPFDAVFSNFGGLNCTPNLAGVLGQLPSVLAPGGIATVVVMPRICPWELLRAGRDWTTATRRLRPGGVTARVGGLPVATTYYRAGEVRRAFGPRFRPAGQEGLALLTPPADNQSFARRRPRLYRLLAWLDERLRRRPLLRGWGDFFILSMRFDG